MPLRKYYSLTTIGREYLNNIKEIKSSILEMENDGFSDELILGRLGKPKDLAKSYLANLLIKEQSFNWNRVLIICAFYILVGFSGLFIIPILFVITLGFIGCAIITPFLGVIKIVDQFLFNIPLADDFTFQVGRFLLTNPWLILLVSFITTIILFIIGFIAWKLLVLYCKVVGKTKNSLLI